MRKRILTIAIFAFVNVLAYMSYNPIADANSQFNIEEENSDQPVINWSSIVVSKIMSFDNNNFDDVVRDVETYFTKTGYGKYKDALIQSGIKDYLVSREMAQKIILRSAPKVISKKDNGDYFLWNVEMAVTIHKIKSSQGTSSLNTNTMSNNTNIILRIKQPKDKNLPVGLEQIIVYDDEIADKIKEIL